MAIEAYRLRSALGKLNVARSQIQGVRSGVVKNADAQKEIDCFLEEVARILHEEAVLVEQGTTPTIRINNDGEKVFEGTIPYSPLA